MKLPVIVDISASDRAKAWDALRPYKDFRVRVKDLFPVPLIGNWSAGLGGVLTKLVGPDPQSIQEP